MSRGNNAQAKRRREAERDRKKQEKAERAKQRRAEGGGPEIASAEDIQGAAFDEVVEGVREDGTIINGRDGAGSSGPPCRLFVGGLSWDTTADELRKVFEDVGEVVDATIVTDRDTGDSRGFGFVTMADRRAATKAVKQLSGFEVDGRPLRIDMATSR